MTEEQVQVIDAESTEETPNIDELLVKAQQLEELQAKIAEQEAQVRESQLQEKFNQAGVTNFEKLRPFLNSEKLEGESLDELITALSELKPKAKAIGTPSNGGAVNEQAVRQAQLQEAASVAKRSGRVEDIAAYTKLKQTLKKFGGIR
ncbi:hypothetical protein [Lysinibacillus telephonicus]|uniref:hypothetical protein n=1 Tax=Lysinibacillus telephonicus TaxID=1714840 RepID=UPI0037D09CD1